MCTQNAKFLKNEIPQMRGWKVLERCRGQLFSPIFSPRTPWIAGEKRFRNHSAWQDGPTAGFHFFRSRYAAWAFKRMFGSRARVVPVLAEKVFARGRVDYSITWRPFRTYIAKEITLLETPS